MKNILFIVALLITFSSCKKDIEIEKGDYLSFGSFHGECLGSDCVKTYRLEENKLYEDPNKLNGTKIGLIKLSDEEFNQVKDLIDYIPKELFKKESETFGCPDCVGQGGYYVHYFIDGKRGIFRLDTDIDALPNFVQDFAKKIKEKLELL
ncbi:MAG: hypothetical protein ACPGR5_03205 [Chitinophagales bacterium]